MGALIRLIVNWIELICVNIRLTVVIITYWINIFYRSKTKEKHATKQIVIFCIMNEQ